MPEILSVEIYRIFIGTDISQKTSENMVDFIYNRALKHKLKPDTWADWEDERHKRKFFETKIIPSLRYFKSIFESQNSLFYLEFNEASGYSVHARRDVEAKNILPLFGYASTVKKKSVTNMFPRIEVSNSRKRLPLFPFTDGPIGLINHVCQNLQNCTWTLMKNHNVIQTEYDAFKMTFGLKSDKEIIGLYTRKYIFLYYNIPDGFLKYFMPDLRDDAFAKEGFDYLVEINATPCIKKIIYTNSISTKKNLNLALDWASEKGHLEVVKLLLSDSRVDPSGCCNETIREALRNGHLEVVQLLLSDSRADPSVWDNFAIINASRNGHFEIVKLLLSDSRVDPTARNNSAIRLAAKQKHVDIVKLLLSDPRVTPSADENDAIRWASQNGQLEVVEVLLSDDMLMLLLVLIKPFDGLQLMGAWSYLNCCYLIQELIPLLIIMKQSFKLPRMATLKSLNGCFLTPE